LQQDVAVKPAQEAEAIAAAGKSNARIFMVKPFNRESNPTFQCEFVHVSFSLSLVKGDWQ